MSSATPSNPNAASQAVYATADQAINGGSRNLAGGLNARQMELNRLWSYYACQRYTGRKVDWDGNENLEHIEHEVVAQGGVIPPGFYESGSTLPLKFRKPTAPYHLVRVIVNRFTGLLFGKNRAPKVRVIDDLVTDDWVRAFIEETRLWSKFILARTYGGSMGSVAMGFKFVKGKPVVEVHDPRWCFVSFADSESGVLRKFEKRYLYPKEMRDPNTGEWVTGNFWYRRVIDSTYDTVWPAVPVEDNEEPVWDEIASVQTEHGFGFVPVVWIENHDVQNTEDGWPDCEGIYDLSEAIDALHAQAFRGTLSNCDPSTVVCSDSESVASGVQKGSGSALWLERGASANYMEITGAGPTAAMSLASSFRDLALEVAQCVLDTNFSGPARTEAEVLKNYSAMIEMADQLREQYGVGLYRLLNLVLRAARKLEEPVRSEEGGNVRLISRTIDLPPRVEPDDDGVGVKLIPRALGKGSIVNVTWPPYGEPSLSDVSSATAAAAQAKASGLVDHETAIKFVAPFYQIEDVGKVKAAIDAETRKERAMVMQQIQSQSGFGSNVEQP